MTPLVSRSFLPGATVQAFAKSTVPGASPTSSMGAALASAVVDAGGILTLEGLDESQDYVLTDGTTRVIASPRAPSLGEYTLRSVAQTFSDDMLLSVDLATREVTPRAAAGYYRFEDEGAWGTGLTSDYAALANTFTKAATVALAGGTAVIEANPTKNYLLSGEVAAVLGALALVPNLPGRLVFVHNGCTITLSDDCARLFDCQYAADDDIWRNIFIVPGSDGAQLQLDVAGTGGAQHVIFGNHIGGSLLQANRQNFENIVIRGVRGFNVPTSSYVSGGADGYGSLKREGVYIGSRHTANGQALNYMKRIVLDDIRMEGGNNCAVLAGTGPDASSGDGQYNIFTDQIYARELYIDTGGFGGTKTDIVPSGCLGVGSRGYGGWYYAEACEFYNTGDIGIELNGGQNMVIEDSFGQDARTACFYHTNFHAPLYPNDSVFRVVKCRAVRLNETNTKGVGGLLGDTGVASSDFEIEDFRFLSRVVGPPNSTNGGIALNSCKTGRVTIKGVKIVEENFNNSVGVNGPQSVFLRVDEREAGVPTVITIDDLVVQVQGTRTGGTFNWTGIFLSPKNGICNLSNIMFDVALTGLTGSSFHLIDVGNYSGWGVPNVIDLSLRHVRVRRCQVDGATSMNGLIIRANTTLTLPRPIRADDVDFSGMPVGKEFNIDASQTAPLRLSRPAWRAASTIKPAARTQLCGASPYTYTNTNIVPEQVTVPSQGLAAGTVVTKIEKSCDGGATFTDLKLLATTQRLQVSDQLRVSYTVTTGAAPTLPIVPEVQ